MTENEIVALFVVMAGYWPHTAPDPEDQVAIAAHAKVFDDLAPDIVLAAVHHLSIERGATDRGDFCPPPGVIAAACKPKIVPPYHAPYVPELEAVVAEELDVPALLEETRKELRYRKTQQWTPAPDLKEL
jgi:hypothetical protein